MVLCFSRSVYMFQLPDLKVYCFTVLPDFLYRYRCRGDESDTEYLHADNVIPPVGA